MTFARRGSLETQIVATKALIEQASGLLRQAIGGHLPLELSIDRDLWSIEVNANQLELVLLNLAINARDAMPDGGKLRLAARNVSLSGSPDGLMGKFVEISVSDTGCGMPPEIAAKAVEPFFTTKEPGKGTGLGISQVHGFAKGCGGTMTLTSAVGRGTTVTIYIPKYSVSDHPERRSFKRHQSATGH
jgi:signal transduction histidine kinase